MKCLGLSTTAAADLILISHGLEVSDNQDLLLQEVRRVLKDSGKLVIIVPNRTGFWARSDSTPFGYGKPYSISTNSTTSKKPVSN